MTESRSCLPPLHEKAMPSCKTGFMITIPAKDCNSFSQDAYDEMIGILQFHQLQCKCGHCGCLIRYGHYERHLRLFGVFIPLSIQRVRCKDCGKTHAIIPSLIVPYSQVPLEDQQEILERKEKGESVSPVMERNILIDESLVRHIIKRFRVHWKERILALMLTLLDDLVEPCLSTYGLQFMQVHRTWNSFFPPPT